MQLFRIHAYEVIPQRLSVKKIIPSGGAFNADTAFTAALDDYIEKAKLTEQPPVSFRSVFVDGATIGTNLVRDRIRDYTFGKPPTAKSAAVFLADRLSESMDDRSVSCLLLLAVYRRDDQYRFFAWAFPKDEPFGFGASKDRAKIRILKNAFSRSSSYRKAAFFEGIESDLLGFWKGNIIDKQSTIADYWVSNFLDSKYEINSRSGTQLLARVLRKTHQDMESRQDKDQITSSIISVRGSQRPSWSLKAFANEFLNGKVKAKFLQNSTKETQSAVFKIDKPLLEEQVSLRVFRLVDDVVVMAPFDSIDHSVKITGKKERILTCKGPVVEEKVRSRRAR